MSRKNLPKYCLHKPSGRAYARFNGETYYLGKYGTRRSSPESWAEYDRLSALFLVGGHKMPQSQDQTGITVEKLAFKFLEWAAGYYRKNGKPTNSVGRAHSALTPVIRYFVHSIPKDGRYDP